MGSRGPLPKPAHTRQRTNKITGQQIRSLPTVAQAAKQRVPPMPERPKKGKQKREWSAPVREWWTAVWRSPMAAMWLESDVKAIMPHLLALHQFAHDAENAKDLLPILTVIQRQESRLGISPSDRRRLL